MDLILTNTSGQPIYQQIATQIKNQIISGGLQEGQPLPSIRSLAKDLRISVITTKRAYDELEAEGFLYTVAGKGCFVAEKDTSLIQEERLKEIEGLMVRISRLAVPCNITIEDLVEMLRTIDREETQ